MKQFFKIIGIIVAVIVCLAVIICVESQFMPDKPPSDFLITHNIVDLSQIDTISKFRSCDGHETIPAWSTEPHSNTQHYFYGKPDIGDGQLAIYAPFDGYVFDGGREGISMYPLSTKFPWWMMNQWHLSVLHSKLLPQFEGPPQKVTAGTLLGYAVKEDANQKFESMDVRVGVIALPPQCMDGNCEPYKKMDSIFNYMSNAVFAQYQKTFPGLTNRSDMIISKDFRLANQCVFKDNGPFFDTPQSQFITEHEFTGVSINDSQAKLDRMNALFQN